MEVKLTPAVVEALKEYSFNENEGLRIETTFVGSCSVAEEHSLKIDQRDSEDDVFTVDGISVLVSKESQKHLHEKITLDFNPNLGYKLSSAEEIYRYNLTIEKGEI